MVPQWFDMAGQEDMRSDDEATAMRQVRLRPDCCVHALYVTRAIGAGP